MSDNEKTPPRQITVSRETRSAWVEYNRDIKVLLEHNPVQTSILRLNRAEAVKLYVELGDLLFPRVVKPEDDFTGPGYDAHPGQDHEDCCK